MTEYTEEQKKLLQEAEHLDAQEQTSDYDDAIAQEQEAQAQAEVETAQEAAAGTAAVVVAVTEQLLALAMPHIEITKEQKEQVQVKLAPVLIKYQSGHAPAWLVDYQEELQLAATLSLVSFSVYQQHKAAQEAALQKAKEAQQELPLDEQAQSEQDGSKKN